MKPYQEEYLALQNAATAASAYLWTEGPAGFRARQRASAAAVREARQKGSALLREQLFPAIDAIHTASPEELADLEAFAAALTALRPAPDAALSYRIHMALVSYARHWDKRDMLIRELYQAGMDLYNLESFLGDSNARPYMGRMGLYFSQCAAYFETDYDAIEDPETRGFIHRAMGNIALSIDAAKPAGAARKLAAVNRSLRILMDPDIRARTPSLPWELYVYKSHQERTTLLSFLRSGQADADAFAQVLESAQIIEQHQQKLFAERGESLPPRWQYAYLAARYHCGALTLPELLEGLYALSAACDGEDFSQQSLFCHVSAPAYYMGYAKELQVPRLRNRAAVRQDIMTRRMFRWIARIPYETADQMLSFSLLQFLSAYREQPACMDYARLVENILPVCQPARYVRARLVERIARQLYRWGLEDCPEEMTGLPAQGAEEQVGRAGFLADAGMLFFSTVDGPSCRGMFAEEQELLQLHGHYGAAFLADRASTAPYAEVARGHHCRWDGKGGFPRGFSVKKSPARTAICLVAVADALAGADGDLDTRFFPAAPLEETVESILVQSGGRYAPFAAELLRPEKRREQLRAVLPAWREEAYRDLFDRRGRLAE